MPAMRDAIVEKGWWVKGLTTCRGVVVVRPRFVAFVPTERPKSLAVEFAWGAAGFVEVGARRLDPAALIAEIERAPSPDDRARELAAELHGVFWSTEAARLLERRIPLRRKHRGLWFQNGKESVRLGRAVPVAEIEAARGILAGWPPAA